MATTRSNPKRTRAYREANNKSVVIPFRGTPDEKAALISAAEAEGRSLSDYIRRALRLRAVRKKQHPATASLMINVEQTRRDIAGLVRNINQLTMIKNVNGDLSASQIETLLSNTKSVSEIMDRLDRRTFGDDDEEDQ